MTVATVTLARTLPLFRDDCPSEGARRNVTTKMRDAEKVNSTNRPRYVMAWAGLPCSLCGLSGSWVADMSNGARLTFGHTVPLTMYGMTNVANLTPQHWSCNQAAAERDLRGMVEHTVDTLPSKTVALEWRAQGGYADVSTADDDLPTEAAMRLARKGRGLTF